MKALVNKQIKPPFKPNFEDQPQEVFFNIRTDKQALEDTEIPAKAKRRVKMFERMAPDGFDKQHEKAE